MEPLTLEERERLAGMLPSLMLFSIVWSVGASCDKPGRPQFDAWLREHVVASGLALPAGAMFPEGTSVYEWCYDTSADGPGGWVGWMSTVPDFKCDPDKPFSEIIVPTSDTVRYTYLVDRCARVRARGGTWRGGPLVSAWQLVVAPQYYGFATADRE